MLPKEFELAVLWLRVWEKVKSKLVVLWGGEGPSSDK